MRLSPYSPDWVLEGLGESYVIAGQYEEAIAAYRKLLARDPGASLAADAHVGLALSYNALGREKEARDEITKATEIYPRYTVSYLREWQLYKDPAYIERYLATLRRLGLPEE